MRSQTLAGANSWPNVARWPVLTVGAAILCLGSGATGYKMRHPLPRSIDSATYIRVRKEVVANAAAHEPLGEVLFLGDSITERGGLHHLCGTDVFNAGISWAKLGDIESFGPKLAQAMRPKAVFIAIGTNDARPLNLRPVEEWRDHYVTMVRSFGTAPVVLVPAPQLEMDKSGAKGFDPARLTALDAQLPVIAKMTGAKLLPRPAVNTSDGVHPSPEGAGVWRSEMTRSCPITG